MPAQKLQLFTQHSRSWRENRYVYPVISRRAKGLSIGVNLNPDKACNFDCVYCCVDRTVPPKIRTVDMGVLSIELDHMLSMAGSGELYREPPLDQTPPEMRRINDVAFSGDGEPTSSPRFPMACELTVDLLGKHGMTGVKVVVITNATLFDRPTVGRALRFLDQHNGEIWAKLDAGTEEYYRLIDRSKMSFGRVVQNILDAGRIRPIVIQSLFMNVNGEPPSAQEIAAYIDRLRQLKANGCQMRMVQVYTVARKTAETGVTPLPDAALDAITAQVRGLGLPAETYYGVA